MPFPKSPVIWMDGRFVPWDEANVHISTHALHYGSSVFEGVRAYSTPRGPAVFCLDAHLERMWDSAKLYRMPMPYPRETVREAMLEIIARNQHASCYLRPLAFRGSDGFSLDSRRCPVHFIIMTLEWGRYLGPEAIEQGVTAGTSSWRRMAPDTFPAMAKIGGNYINSQFIAMEAADNGYDEGIALDVNGYVSEGSGENIFAVKDGTIYTPPVSASLLNGITRRAVIQIARDLGYTIVETNIAREMLYIVDELFFTGTAAEITPVRSVDHVQVGSGKRGPITKRIADDFFAIAEGRAPDRFGWLTLATVAVPSMDALPTAAE